MSARTFVGVGIAIIIVFSGCAAPNDPKQSRDAQGAKNAKGPGLPEPNFVGVDVPIMHTPAGNFTKLLCDAGVCLRRMTTMTEGPAAEVMVAQDAMNPLHLLAGSKDLHADNPTCVQVSVYGSSDGGRTWVAGYPRPRVGVNGGPTGLQGRCESDPAAAFDGLGNGYMITLDTSQGLFTYKTTDVGKTWKEVAMAFKGGNDKNWAATDFRTHRVYSITRATCNGGEAITYTDDQAASWSKPFCFRGMDFAQVDVGPEGNVYAVGVGQGGISFARSIDGGEVWRDAQSVALVAGGTQTLPVAGGHPYRTPMLPDMAVSLSTGWIYAVWHQTINNQQDIMFSMSTDKGDTWSKPVSVIDDTTGADQFIPAVAASPNGDVHVVFFDARNDPGGRGNTLDMYYAHAKIGLNAGGLSEPKFEKNIRLTAQSFVPYLSRHQQQPFFIGDYIGLTATNNEAVAVFPTTQSGRAEINAAIVGG